MATAHSDNYGDSANTSETMLTPASIRSGHFGKIGSYIVDGYVFAQPLYIPRVRISSRVRNLLIVATMNNNVYAFDADEPGSAPVWGPVNFGQPNTRYPGYANGAHFLYDQGIGCLSTPAADVAAGILYTACMTAENWVLRAQNLATGAVLRSVSIAGQVPGTGDRAGGDRVSHGVLSFYPQKELQRAGLRVAGGTVYVTFGGVGDNHPWHGWVMGYNSALRQNGIWCSTPNSFGGAIWGGEPSIDEKGFLYITTGNGGEFRSDSSTYTNTLVKLSSDLRVVDWFAPANNELINSLDADLGANRAIQIAGRNLIEIAGKDFNVYILDKACLGHLQGTSTCRLQTFKTDPSSRVSLSSGSYGGAFMNNLLYLPLTQGSIFAFSLRDETFDPQPVASTTTPYGLWGAAQMSGSSSRTSEGILWVTTSELSAFSSRQPGTLRALDAKTLAELWNSGQKAPDALGDLAKFVSPVVAGGRVYVANVSGAVNVYGLNRTSRKGAREPN